MNNNTLNRPNRHARRASLRMHKARGERLLDRPASAGELKEARLLQEDPEKTQRRNLFREMWEKVKRSKQHFDLPGEVPLERQPGVARVRIVNKDGVERELLPDTSGQHKILCKGSLARVFTSGCCIFCQITQPGDGSWAICPAAVAMSNQTTIQYVRRRRFWWLRRFSYEISFDGRVQPAYLFYDYDIRPDIRSLDMWVTHETIRVRGTDELNHYYRFWLHKPQKK